MSLRRLPVIPLLTYRADIPEQLESKIGECAERSRPFQLVDSELPCLAQSLPRGFELYRNGLNLIRGARDGVRVGLEGKRREFDELAQLCSYFVAFDDPSSALSDCDAERSDCGVDRNSRIG